ncbi:1-deoxy-D-xylulose 5-phosphate reductoisomerase [Granulicella rosea]|uniref:1-deoxy-D-xylulose 5-phosphate reductoisomerase n=1 Tax=Granulicella rosea TaxID=474952 RepID=A0A239DZZ9_9BACT|nr:1-deoxy-D-xylulose-5-phosphate reductoisomerase [Granulicella rosea]SNS38040.1 1-deoxy-D-xylulose 5-phosphate reductoisomerase [Granulicella rosea]
MKKIAILGSTGSIGASTLSICESFPDRYLPVALAAGSNVDAAFEQAKRWRPTLLSIATEAHAAELRARLKSADIPGVEVVWGTAGTVAVATHPEIEFVVSAIVGVAGLEATYAAVQAGKTIGLANKECLVAAGDLIIAAAREKGVALLPIDSEHNAVHQCMRGGAPAEVKQVWLTASGGPFRNTPAADFAGITPAQALKHPTWVMGQRITIDSATMMNKGFEVIEACRLFDLPAAQVRVTVHPQSTVHSLVEFIDGSILAQISVTDMRLPILYALAYPERPKSDLTFDLSLLSHLDFSQPDLARFPCLRLAYEAADAGPSACIALNAADEIAVAAFLSHEIPFLGIPRTIERVLELTPAARPASISEVLAADRMARTVAREVIASHSITEAHVSL